jgi:hypothetical protein
LTDRHIDDLNGGVAQAVPKLPKIHEEELTPLVVALSEIIHLQQDQIQELRDEIARL